MAFKGYKHSKEARRKMSASHKGVSLSKEHRKNIGEASKKAWNKKTVEERERWVKNIQQGIGDTSPMKGKCHTDESKKKNSESNRGTRRSIGTEFKTGSVPWMKGKRPTDASLRKNSDANKKRITQEMRKKTSDRMKALWSDPNHAKKCLIFNSPNKSEIKLLSILDNLYPGEWKFVGDGKVVIAGKCPDFINVNGQKKIIELWGKLWHQEDDPQDRINIFLPFGYETLIILDRELNNCGRLESRLREFCEDRHA